MWRSGVTELTNIFLVEVIVLDYIMLNRQWWKELHDCV